MGWAVRPAGRRVPSARSGIEDGIRPHGAGVRDPILSALSGVARRRSGRARPGHPDDSALAACQSAAAPLARTADGAARTGCSTRPGDALADYLRHGRPAHPSRRVFLTLTDPVRAFDRPAAITKIVQRNLVRAGIPL